MRPLTDCVANTDVFDYTSADFQRFVSDSNCFQEMNATRAVERLHDAVRDSIDYNVFDVPINDELTASSTVREGSGFCLHKSILFVAACRSLCVPAVLCSDVVTNHVADAAMIELVGGEEFLHWFTEIYLNGRWVRAAPVFNSLLCMMYGVDVLKFDPTGGRIEQKNSDTTKMKYMGVRRKYVDPSMRDLISIIQEKHPKMVTSAGRTPTSLSLVGSGHINAQEA